MSQENHERKSVIPVEMIKDTVMPPYHYQVLQNNFGKAGTKPDSEEKEVVEKPSKD